MEQTTSKMKRMLALMAAFALSAIMVFALAGCGSSSSSANSGKTYKVAIVQLADNDAFTEMTTAFKDKMTELGYTEGQNITYDMQSAQGDMSNLNTIAANDATADYDLIVPIVTPAAQAVVNAGPSCPVVFISVTDPVGAGIMSSMDAPDKNATGTSNIIPVDEIFNLANTLVPGSNDNIGLLYCSGEKNASLTVSKAKTYLESAGIKYTERSVANSSEVQQAAQSLASTCTMIYIPVDSTVQSAMPQVVEAATAAKIPVFGSDPVMVQSGALASISVSNTQLGQRSAEMADQILKGTAVSDVPAEAMSEYQRVVNKQTCEALGIAVPTDSQYTVIDTTTK